MKDKIIYSYNIPLKQYYNITNYYYFVKKQCCSIKKNVHS